MKKNILCVGPITPPITGQSLCFEFYVRNSNHNVNVLNINLTGFCFFRKILHSFGLILRFYYLLFFNKYDSLYITTSRSDLGFITDAIVILSFKLYNGGLIINHLHGADFSTFRHNSKFKSIVDFVYSKIDKSIVLSERMKEQYSCYKNMDVFVVPNFSHEFISREKIDRKKYLFESGCLNILYLSNLMYSKGVTYLIDAVKKINLNGFNIRLTLAGQFLSDADMSGTQLKSAIEKNLDNNIKYVGVLRDNKFDYLENANVVCLPTFYKTEAQPLAVIEGLAFANLVITTNHNYNSDFLPKHMVVWVEKENSDDIYNKIYDICVNRESYVNMLEQGFQYALQEFDKFKYIDQIDDIVSSL